ncbi:DUF2235 domain-containing protein (plasmid) [Paraburkholderia sprentiae WSM5005]|uniref:DUF2235 domain-containing protein n=1 Tax=Paraburkholderia sprentiae WSM5005 TaxID=754502 RepID=A0A1I9YU31_9BURK|nr:DUF2235 domain-containing protein [Paraburkholderia sprentiae]APA89741.1 DUF2235 domain-containing protein [Paraburkholderia sprentiae WSM5005]
MSKNETAISATAATETSPSMADRVTRAVSFTSTQPSTPPDGCYRCHQEIYVSFFFDGFGQSLKSSDPSSNVSRLYHAHRGTDKSEGIYRLYYEGMGRLLSKERTGVAGALASEAANRAKDAVADQVKDSISDARKDATKDFTKEATAAYKAGTKGGIKSALLNALGKFEEGIQPGAIATKVGTGLASAKLIVSTGVQVAVNAIPSLRDSELAAAWLGTGFDARVDAATKDFTAIIKQAQSDPRPIRFIRIAMFGYDRGAVAARKFASDLIEKVCKKDAEKITYQGAEVLFDFMGLFDSVSSAYADSFFAKVGTQVLTAAATVATPEAGGLGGVAARVSIEGISQLIAAGKRSLGEFDTPGVFRKVVHHVAATELRFYKPLDSSRNSKGSGNLTEIVYPGSQSDVGGGFVDGDDGKSAELAKVSARNMLDQAWAYGVPVRRLEELRAAGDPDTLRQFTFTKSVLVNGKALTVNDLFGAYAALMPSGKSTLEHHFLAHQKLFVSWARTLHDRTGKDSTGNHLFVNMIDASVYNEIFAGAPTPDFGVRADYYKEAEQGALRPDLMGQTHTLDDIRDPAIRELATAWVKPAPLSAEVTAFFDNFVHNTITRANNVSLGDGVFLQLRSIEDKSRKDQLHDKVNDAASDARKKLLPDPDRIRQAELKGLQDAGTWSQGSQRYPDPLGLGSSIGNASSLNNLIRD